MRRVDHAGIYVLIAGTYTAVGLLALHGTLQATVLLIVWIGAGFAALMKFCWVRAPKWVSVVTALALGWVGNRRAAAARGERRAGRGRPPARRRARLLGRRDRLRAAQARSGADDLRVPRGLPRADARRDRLPVRGDRVLHRAPRLKLNTAYVNPAGDSFTMSEWNSCRVRRCGALRHLCSTRGSTSSLDAARWCLR